MARYIDAEQAQLRIKSLCENYNIAYGNRYGGFGKEIARILENVPTADVQEVKHGEWIDNTKYLERVCSNCGREVVYQIIDGCWEYENYCPHCGATMDGKENEE